MAEPPKDQPEAIELGLLLGAIAKKYSWADWANYRTVDMNGDIFDWDEQPKPVLNSWHPPRPCKFDCVGGINKTVDVWNLLIVKKP